MALTYVRDYLFVDDPLMLISTWDGDVLSLAQFDLAAQSVLADPSGYLESMGRYHECLIWQLSRHGIDQYALHNGMGWFNGPVSTDLASMFRRGTGRRLISCPAPGAMRRFVRECQP